MKLADILNKSSVVADVKGESKQDILAELATPLKTAGLIEDISPVVKIVMEREALGSTGIGDGVAIPHGKLKNIDNIFCTFGRSKKGVDFDAIDGEPVHIFFLVLAPEDSASQHLKVLSRISKILRDQSFRRKLLNLTDANAIFESIVEEDEKF